MAGTDPSASGSAAAGGASIKEAATSALSAAKDTASGLASSVQGKVAQRIEQGKGTVGHTMADFAGAIRKAADELAEHDQSLAGRVIKQGADGLESLSRAITDKRPDELLDAVRDFGRKSPVAFIAGSVLIGLAIGRFAKSSQSQDGGRQPVMQPGQPTLPTGILGISPGAGEGQAGGYGDAYAATPVASPGSQTLGSNGSGI